MINILILEDKRRELEKIQQAITEHLGHLVELYPRNILPKEGNLNDFDVLIKAMRAGEFEEVLEFYPMIDLFIIDVNLRQGTDDRMGIEFYEHLQKTKGGRPNAIIISNTDDNKRFLPDDTPFVAKLVQGLDLYTKELVGEIRKKYRISDSGSTATLTLFDLFRERVKLFGFKYATHHLILPVTLNIKRYFIDPLILLFFYTLLALTVMFGWFNILVDIIHLHVKDENHLLTTAEHLFLNFLPIFIVFGFFNYYKSNIRIWLLEGNTFAVNEEKSTKAMNMSKILFISSIVSYASIKVLELIFLPEKVTDPSGVEKEKEIDLYRLSAAGIFLVILMFYYVFLDRKHQHEPKALKRAESVRD